MTTQPSSKTIGLGGFAEYFYVAKNMDWQPIETYEHGDRGDLGGNVLIAIEGGLVGEAYFNPKSGVGTWWWSGTHDGEYADSPIYSPVTHWMPLPDPPQVQP